MGYCDKTPNVKYELSARDDVLIKDRCRTRSVASAYFRDGLVQDFTSDGVNLTITLKDGSTKTTSVEGVIAGTFEEGLTVASNADVVAYADAGSQSGNYNWTGDIPEGGKIVPPGSTPESTGGIGPGAWLPNSGSTERTLIDLGYNPVGSWPESGQPDVVLSGPDDVIQYTDGVYRKLSVLQSATISASDEPIDHLLVRLDERSDVVDLASYVSANSDVSTVLTRVAQIIPDNNSIRCSVPAQILSPVSISGKKGVNLRFAELSLSGTQNGTQINFSNSENCSLTNSRIVGNNDNSSADRPSLVGLSGSHGFRLSGNIINDVYFGVATLAESNGVSVNDNYCYGTLTYDPAQPFLSVSALAYGQETSKNWEVTNNRCDNINSLTLGGGTIAWTVSENRITGSIDSAIYLFNSRHIVSNNYIFQAGKDGIKILDNINPSENEHNVIEGNVVYGSGYVKTDGGVGISSAGSYNVVNGNTVYMAAVADLNSPSQTGIFHNGPNSEISNNTVKSFDRVQTGSGITVSTATSPCSGVNVTNNTLVDVKQNISISQSDSNPANDISIRGNHIYGAQNGILPTSEDRSLFRRLDVAENIFSGNQENFSTFTSSDGLTDPRVRNNRSSETSGFAYRLNGDLGGLEFAGQRTDGSESSFINGSTDSYLLRDNKSGDLWVDDNVIGVTQVFTIDDNSVSSVAIPGSGALVSIASSFGIGCGLASLRLTGGNGSELLSAGANLEVATGPLTGTTGTDGKLTVSVDSGTMYIENRLGSQRKIKYSVITAPV